LERAQERGNAYQRKEVILKTKPEWLAHSGIKRTYMKGIFIAFDQAHKDAVISTLDKLNCRGFSFIEQLQGRGSKTGEPHYGTHAWASMNSGIITMVDDNIVDKLLEALKNIDENAEMLGLRAFVWNIEQCY
jgi:nitrogen regulatory protein PII